MRRGDCVKIASLAVFAAFLLTHCPASAGAREDAVRLLEEGMARLGEGDTGKALKAFSQAGALDPANPLPYYNIGVLTYGEGRYRDAVEDFGMAVSVSPPGFADAMINQGVASAALMWLEEAIVDYSNAIMVAPGDPDAYYNRGLAYQRLRDLHRPMAPFVMNPADGSRFDFSPLADSREAQLASAIEDFTNAVRIDPDDSWAYRNRGLAYAEGQDYAPAFLDYDRALALDAADPLSCFFRGTTYGIVQDFNRALIDLDRAIQLDPSLVEAFIARGAVLTILDDLEGALADFDRALALDLRSYDAFNLRGVVFNRMGNTREAMYNFQRAIDIDQTRPEAYENRAAAFSSEEEFRQAQEDCEEAVRRAPGYADRYMSIVDACEWTAGPRRAAKAYENFVRFASPETGIQMRLSSERLKPARSDY